MHQCQLMLGTGMWTSIHPIPIQAHIILPKNGTKLHKVQHPVGVAWSRCFQSSCWPELLAEIWPWICQPSIHHYSKGKIGMGSLLIQAGGTMQGFYHTRNCDGWVCRDAQWFLFTAYKYLAHQALLTDRKILGFFIRWLIMPIGFSGGSAYAWCLNGVNFCIIVYTEL